VTHKKLDVLLDATRQWGRIRAVVRSNTGAVSELMINGHEFQRRGDWLVIENDHFHLHIEWSRVAAAWFLRRGETLRGVHFVDATGETLFNLSLLRKENAFDKSAEQQFEESWHELSM
jgi:precorrin-3B C17-methyltransferase